MFSLSSIILALIPLFTLNSTATRHVYYYDSNAFVRIVSYRHRQHLQKLKLLHLFHNAAVAVDRKQWFEHKQ